jgi:hypothetical protein
MKYVILSLIMVILASCSGAQAQTPTSVQIETVLSPATEAQAVINKTPTAIVEVSPSPTSSVYDFPSWMSNSDTTVLAALFRDDLGHTRKIYFFNVTTGEKFELNPTMPFGGFFWYDNRNFGLLAKDLNSAYKLNLQTGQVYSEPVSPQSTRFLSKDWVNGLVIFNEASNGGFTFDDARQTNKSLNKVFTAQWIDDKKAISVTDTKTNQVIWEATLPENRYGTEILWSPVSENYLAFLQGSPEPLNGFIIEDMSLTMVNVVEGKILSSYDGDFGILRWSPDGKMILYQNPWFRYRNYGVSFRDAPCLLILGIGEKRCLRNIPRVIPAGYELLTTGVYRWANDSNSIYYTYLYSLPSQWNILGNLCNYSLIDSHINCPTQDLEALHGRSVIYYDLSPDEQFIHFCYSTSTILNDYADIADDGIIKVDGSGFFSWVGTIQDGGPQTCSIDTLWRPLP